VPDFHFKLVETRSRYWHWVMYCDGKAIAASAKALKSQREIATQIKLIQQGAAKATLKIAPMKLDEHMEKKAAMDKEEDVSEAVETTEVVDDAEHTGQSLPANEAVEG